MPDYNLGTARGVIEVEYKGDGLRKARTDLDDTKTKASKVNEAAGVVGKGMAGAGTAIAAGFAVAVKSAQDYEKRMSAVQAVSGASAGEMKQLSDLALKLGAETKYSASESASAIEELVKAGLTVPDVMNGAAQATVNLAAAGEIDLPKAAEIASNAMNQFGLSANEMPKIADAIAGAANASAIDVKEFGYSLSQAGAVANLAGLDFQDTAVAIAEMGNAGIKGSDAGTSLKSFLQNLQPTTAKQTQLFKEMGLATYSVAKAQEFLRENGIEPLGDSEAELTPQIKNLVAQLNDVKPGSAAAEKAFAKLDSGMALYSNGLYDTEGNMKSLADIQEILRKSTSDMTAEQKQANLETLFGSDAIRAAAVLSKNGAKGYDDMAAAMGKVTAEQVAQTRQKNLAGQWEQLTGSLETMAIQIGQIVIPWLSKLVEGVQWLVDAWSKLSPQTQKIIVIIAAVVGVFLLLVGGVLALIAPFVALVAVFSAAGVALLPVIGIVAAVIAALILLAVTVYTVIKNWSKIKGFFESVWGAIADFFAGLWSRITSIFKTAVGGITSFFTSAWGGIVSFFTGIWSGIAGFFAGLWASITGVVGTAWAAIRGVIASGVMFVQSILTTALNVLLGPWRAFWSVFGGLFTAVWELVKAVAALGLRLLQYAIFTTLFAVRDLWNTVWGGIVAFFTSVWSGIVGFISPIIAKVRSVITTAVSAIASFWTKQWTFVRNVFTNAWNLIVARTAAFIAAVRAKIQGPLEAVRAFIASKLTAARNLFTSAWNSILATVNSVWGKISGAVAAKINDILRKITAIKDKVVNTMRNAGSWLYNAGKDIIQGLIDGVTRKIRQFTDLLRDLTNMIPDLKGPHSTDIRLLEPAGGDIIEGLIRGTKDRIPEYANLLSALTSSIPAMAASGGGPTVPVAPTTNVRNTGASIHQDVKIYYPVAERSSKAVNESLQFAGAFGEVG